MKQHIFKVCPTTFVFSIQHARCILGVRHHQLESNIYCML